MNAYTFNIEFPDGEILCETRTAASRFTAEMILSDEYPDAVDIDFIDVN